jgi:hypothetical protein
VPMGVALPRAFREKISSFCYPEVRPFAYLAMISLNSW